MGYYNINDDSQTNKDGQKKDEFKIIKSNLFANTFIVLGDSTHPNYIDAVVQSVKGILDEKDEYS